LLSRVIHLTISELAGVKNLVSATRIIAITQEVNIIAAFLRATAVPAGTAERVSAMAIPSVCPSGMSPQEI